MEVTAMLLSRRALPALTLLAAPLPARAQAQANVRFIWDWAPAGYHAPWALADQRGFFKAQGLNVTQDRGYGSGDTIAKVASGAYDIGLADVNSLVRYNALNPDRRVIAVFILFDRNPAAVTALKRSGIRGPADLKGRHFGAPEGESSRVLFPVYAKAAGIDLSTIRWTSMTANLREAMLATGQVEAITGLQQSTFFSLRAAGVPPDQIVMLPYADAGVDLYGHAVIVAAAWAEKNGDTIRAFLRAAVAGTKAALADPKAGMAAMKRRDPLFDEVLELERFTLTRDIAIMTDVVRRDGFGGMTAERMQKVATANAEVNNISPVPSADSLYSIAYLPPQAERMP